MHDSDPLPFHNTNDALRENAEPLYVWLKLHPSIGSH